MQKHKETTKGYVQLNIGGHRFETSVQTLRRVPSTFFDAYFSGRYEQDVCADGSIFVDRDGENFGHILEYMRDGRASVLEDGAHPSVSLLEALKREFDFYCIEPCAEQLLAPKHLEMTYVMGGSNGNAMISSMERYDASSGKWSTAAAMLTGRSEFGSCVLAGELYVTGGMGDNGYLTSVEKFSPSTETWSAVAPLPVGREGHSTVAIASDMYVLGGFLGGPSASMLKFDSTQSTWSSCAPMPGARFCGASCAIGSAVYAFGGYNESMKSSTSVFKYDTMTEEWSTLAPMPTPMAYHHALCIDGLVYIMAVGTSFNEVQRFDPATGAWSSLAPTVCNRRYGAAFMLANVLYAAGGVGDGNDSMVERYDVASNTWTAVADMLEGRKLFGAATIRSAGPSEEQERGVFDMLIAKARKGQ
jgi:N-acetylneuraminic acid mutarotase